VNLTGTFNCIQLAAPDMVEANWGRIVTIASSSAQSGTARMAHYVASKGGVIALTKAFAHEFAKNNVTANTIPPTLVDTPMARNAEATGDIPLPIADIAAFVPLGRAGTGEDIAGAVSFLCSDDASYITGQILGVNGGMYM
jgi:NAD(P)-dependent dehydrogenase (short-subunit alcohol dehydrogenase family)